MTLTALACYDPGLAELQRKICLAGGLRAAPRDPRRTLNVLLGCLIRRVGTAGH